MNRRLRALAAAALLVTTTGAADPTAGPSFAPVETPASGGSAQPNLAVAPDGRVWLSWVEQATGGVRLLRMARLVGDGWGAPVDVVAGDSLLGLDVDPPAILPLSGVRFVAIVPWKLPGRHARELRMIQTHNGGATWLRPVVVHRDGTPTEHGFTSLVMDSLGARAIWLDGRNAAVADSLGGLEIFPEGVKDMMLRTAVLTADGRLVDERELDARVCDCCPTAAVATGSGTLVAYRDRSDAEVRDISVLRRVNGAWSGPVMVHEDGWEIMGCPVNGPAIDAAGARAAVAWYSGAGDSARVFASFSDDGGATFSAPVRVDLGAPMGRAAVAMLEDGAAIVAWLEAAGKEVRVVARTIHRDGRRSPATTAGAYASGRGGGIPRLVRSGDRVVLAWTETGTPSRIRTSLLRAGAAAAR